MDSAGEARAEVAALTQEVERLRRLLQDMIGPDAAIEDVRDRWVSLEAENVRLRERVEEMEEMVQIMADEGRQNERIAELEATRESYAEQLHDDYQSTWEKQRERIAELEGALREVRVYGNSGTRHGDCANVPEDWDERVRSLLTPKPEPSDTEQHKEKP
jgi:chromosome segregation ATPase